MTLSPFHFRDDRPHDCFVTSASFNCSVNCSCVFTNVVLWDVRCGSYRTVFAYLLPSLVCFSSNEGLCFSFFFSFHGIDGKSDFSVPTYLHVNIWMRDNPFSIPSQSLLHKDHDEERAKKTHSSCWGASDGDGWKQVEETPSKSLESP